MRSIQVDWEDEENNRVVGFSVDYVFQEVDVKVVSMAANKVTFLCEDTKTPLRSIGVHRDAGQKLLATAFCQSKRYAELLGELRTAAAVA